MVMIQGVVLTSVTVEKDAKIIGKFDLMSSAGKVLAKQGFNSYLEMEIKFSAPTLAKVEEALACIKSEVEMTLGLV